MENKNNNKVVIALLIVIIIILSALCVLFATGTISFNLNKTNGNDTNENVNNNNKQNDKVTDNSNEINDTNSLVSICTVDEWDSKYLKELVMENKKETIHAIGSGVKGYNVTTTVTKEHNYTSAPEDEELYATDMFGTLYVLYKNRLYYTSRKDIISSYCETINGSTKLSCDYSKINDNTIKSFDTININLNFKAIGSYGNSGSGSSYPYAITTDGKVINIPKFFDNNYNSCGILYDNSEYPIDRIFNMYFYEGPEYTILLKDGTLITRKVDYEHPIELED